VQYRPSSQEVPAKSGLDTARHASTSSSHTAVWQLPTDVPAHEREAPGTHCPLTEQVSPAVQKAPSSQVPPTLRTKQPSQQSLMPPHSHSLATHAPSTQRSPVAVSGLSHTAPSLLAWASQRSRTSSQAAAWHSFRLSSPAQSRSTGAAQTPSPVHDDEEVQKRPSSHASPTFRANAPSQQRDTASQSAAASVTHSVAPPSVSRQRFSPGHSMVSNWPRGLHT
jgi:hypothetical protein